ncbi:MAG: hypothetical protein SFV51_25160 [Bryobacteraceae bacterium]|nr:hypothetical protein [Bryobacteraceae bacterium]
MSIFFGHGHCRIVRDGISWQSTEETVEILNAAVPALCGASSVTISRQRASIAMHIQLRSGPFIRTLRPLISTHLPSLEAEPIQTMAAVVKWQNRKVTVDGSAAVANGVFLRLEREFSWTASYSEIATRIRSGQDSVFELLGVGESQS